VPYGSSENSLSKCAIGWLKCMGVGDNGQVIDVSTPTNCVFSAKISSVVDSFAQERSANLCNRERGVIR
jgi:hypothetical protein